MKQRINLNNSDWKVLKSLWKWKTLSASALAKLCYPDLSQEAAYKRIWRLENDNLIFWDSGRIKACGMWTLAQAGFQSLLALLPDLKDSGYKSESLLHDFVASSIHLGDSVYGDIAGVKTFSEQELRRFHKEHFPDWVPQSDQHRPDGYWLAQGRNGEFTVALEVERSPKPDITYEVLADFYSQESQIKRVVWLAATQSRCENIHRKIQNALRGKPMNHNFLDYPSFLKLGWDAPFVAGPESSKTLRFLLGIKPGDCCQTSPTNLLLDTRKAPYSSTAWKPFRDSEFRY